MKKAKGVLRAVSCVAFVLLVMLFYLFPEYFIFAIFGAASEFGSNSHRIVWNVLDDECFGKEIELNFWTPVSASRVETAKRTVTIGKTKRIRLPQKMYFMLDDAENPEDLCVFVPYESCWRENKDTGKREKSPHEIVVFAKPSVAEDDECFRINKSSARINSAVENARCSLCYFDFELYQFVWIDLRDGVFFKKDKRVRKEKDLPCPDTEGLVLCFFVQSMLYEDESYNVPVKYKRDEEALRSEKQNFFRSKFEALR